MEMKEKLQLKKGWLAFTKTLEWDPGSSKGSLQLQDWGAWSEDCALGSQQDEPPGTENQQQMQCTQARNGLSVISKVSSHKHKIPLVFTHEFINSFEKPLNQVPGLQRASSRRDERLNKQIECVLVKAKERWTQVPWESRGVPAPAPGRQAGLLPEVGQEHRMCEGWEPGTEALRGGHGMVGTPGCLQRAEAHDARKARSDELERAGACTHPFCQENVRTPPASATQNACHWMDLPRGYRQAKHPFPGHLSVW